jgi:NNP family nitrate/nitrite transporter-like MFS transporter
MSRWVDDWRPEDPEFWAGKGRAVARRNLIFSILAEHLGFSVWLLWSAVVASLGKAGFHFSLSQLFWLVAVPNLVGALLRLPYTFAVPRFGGRNWTIFSAAVLLLPVLLLVVMVTHPHTPYWMFLVAAGFAGLGGGNFASSMANISYFYPESRKGLALGLNAAGGNIGVAVVQRLVPLVIGVGVVGAAQKPGLFLQNAGLVYVVPILIAVACAWFFMDNLRVSQATFASQLGVLRSRHMWVMSMLYIGTFGSFIGFSAAFPLLIAKTFPDVTAASVAFLGPLVGSLARPFGGWLADRVGGARITAVNFAVMGLCIPWAIASVHSKSWPSYLAAFLVLFVTTGVGNGSTFRMIPAIFRGAALENAGSASREEALANGRRDAAAVLGMASAIGALGGFAIPVALGMSSPRGTAAFDPRSLDPAFIVFVAFYAVCLVTTWWFYLRRRVLVRLVPSLATAGV